MRIGGAERPKEAAVQDQCLGSGRTRVVPGVDLPVESSAGIQAMLHPIAENGVQLLLQVMPIVLEKHFSILSVGRSYPERFSIGQGRISGQTDRRKPSACPDRDRRG